MAPRLPTCVTTFVVSTTIVNATITEKELIPPPNASFKASTRSERSQSSLLCPGGEWNHAGQVVWLSWVQDCTIERNAVFGHSVTPEPAKFHLKYKPTNRMCSSLTHCTAAVATRNTVLHAAQLQRHLCHGLQSVGLLIIIIVALKWCNNMDTRQWLPTMPLSNLTSTIYCSQLKYIDVFATWAILLCLTAPHLEGQPSVVTVSFWDWTEPRWTSLSI